MNNQEALKKLEELLEDNSMAFLCGKVWQRGQAVRVEQPHKDIYKIMNLEIGSFNKMAIMIGFYGPKSDLVSFELLDYNHMNENGWPGTTRIKLNKAQRSELVAIIEDNMALAEKLYKDAEEKSLNNFDDIDNRIKANKFRPMWYMFRQLAKKIKKAKDY